MSRDDAVVEDEVDVGLGRETTEGGCIVFPGLRFDGGDAEVLVAPGEMSAGGGYAGFGVSRNGGVAIENKVAVGGEACRVGLSAGETGKKEYKDYGPVADQATK